MTTYIDFAMSTATCPDCGAPVDHTVDVCPECGCPIDHEQEKQPDVIPPVPEIPEDTVSDEYVPDISDETTTRDSKTDWAQYFYECGVIGWEAFKKYCCFTGRSSRREFWSFYLVCMFVILSTSGLAGIIFLLPMIGVSIRRMHDINKCGWWSICPFACLFLFLKRSDVGPNNYGDPNPAKNLL